ncbi:hypothetical protein BDR03DRAFT_541633 [Suillus americanus]|nr:hypothetical protein BDR03DRAFT_541633 [Suillus americanus]
MDVGRAVKHGCIIDIKPFRSCSSLNTSSSYDIAFVMYTTDLEAQQMLVYLYAIVVANCILIYDHIATLPEEIAFIWCRPKALSAMLFLVNRYVALLGNIFGLFSEFLPVSNKLFEIRGSPTSASCFPTSLHLPDIVSSHLCFLRL